ncbi:hypothetical protein [Rhodomicrobium sp. R_RK_3]|uniref:hypothetical protein n=1 Tax=Rhodomicrobium sp. R_RK_3 TaxID=2029567 RepID=UPI000B4ABB58|nr:hypothetical protein [Rhodomicrobium sp. R_RK_3]
MSVLSTIASAADLRATPAVAAERADALQCGPAVTIENADASGAITAKAQADADALADRLAELPDAAKASVAALASTHGADEALVRRAYFGAVCARLAEKTVAPGDAKSALTAVATALGVAYPGPETGASAEAKPVEAAPAAPEAAPAAPSPAPEPQVATAPEPTSPAPAAPEAIPASPQAAAAPETASPSPAPAPEVAPSEPQPAAQPAPEATPAPPQVAAGPDASPAEPQPSASPAPSENQPVAAAEPPSAPAPQDSAPGALPQAGQSAPAAETPAPSETAAAPSPAAPEPAPVAAAPEAAAPPPPPVAMAPAPDGATPAPETKAAAPGGSVTGTLGEEECRALGVLSNCPDLNLALDRLLEKPLEFNRPDTMLLGRKTEIALVLRTDWQGKDLPAEVSEELKGLPGAVQQGISKITRVMSAELTGRDFDITPSARQERTVVPPQPVSWNWQVSPTETGTDKTLKLRLYAHLQGPDGTMPPLLVKTLDASIKVDVTTWDWLVIQARTLEPVYAIGAALIGLLTAILTYFLARRSEPASAGGAPHSGGGTTDASTRYSGPVIGDLGQSATDSRPAPAAKAPDAPPAAAADQDALPAPAAVPTPASDSVPPAAAPDAEPEPKKE